MEKVNKVAIGVGLAVAIGAAGTLGVLNGEEITKFVDCVGNKVQIEYADNYYCGSNEEYRLDTGAAIERFDTNKTRGIEEYGALQLFVMNDEGFADMLGRSLAERYDFDKKEFVGSQFDYDFIYQLQIMTDILNKKGITEIPNGTKEIGDLFYNLYKL